MILESDTSVLAVRDLRKKILNLAACGSKLRFISKPVEMLTAKPRVESSAVRLWSCCSHLWFKIKTKKVDVPQVVDVAIKSKWCESVLMFTAACEITAL